MDSKPSIDEFPFDENASLHELAGLEKLRAINDPLLRKLTYDLYFATEENESNAEFRARSELYDREQRHREFEWLNAIADKAHAGGFGHTGKQLAQKLVPENERRTKPLLEALAKQLRALPKGAR
jgi:hypothetical protein